MLLDRSRFRALQPVERLELLRRFGILACAPVSLGKPKMSFTNIGISCDGMVIPFYGLGRITAFVKQDSQLQVRWCKFRIRLNGLLKQHFDFMGIHGLRRLIPS